MNNKTEQRGFLWLSIVLLAVLLILLLIPHKSKTVPIDESTSEAIAKLESQDSSYRHQRHRSYNRNRNSINQTKQFAYGDEEFTQPNFERNRTEQHIHTIDLNSADTLELQDLYGIGPYFARGIVKYRNLLGGYVSKEQLLEVYGMNDDRYQSIAQYITIDTTNIRKININTADYATLRRHPYIDAYQAKAIIKLRTMGVRFSTPADILKVSIIEPETVNKLTPYITFEDDTIHNGQDGPNA